MYEFTSHVRYSESSHKAELKWLSLVDYFQDCSVAHSESLHVGCDYLAENHIAWVIIGWNIHLEKMPKLCEKIRIQTWPYEMKGFYGRRNFQMLGEDGTRFAYADSTWVMVDTNTGRPTKIPKELQDSYEYDPRIEMEAGARKMVVPTEYEEKTPIEVPEYFLDTNNHMNNGRYLEVAMGYVPEDMQPTHAQIEYRKEAKLHEMLCPRVTIEENAVTVVIADTEGAPYCIVKLEA